MKTQILFLISVSFQLGGIVDAEACTNFESHYTEHYDGGFATIVNIYQKGCEEMTIHYPLEDVREVHVLDGVAHQRGNFMEVYAWKEQQSEIHFSNHYIGNPSENYCERSGSFKKMTNGNVIVKLVWKCSDGRSKRKRVTLKPANDEIVRR